MEALHTMIAAGAAAAARQNRVFMIPPDPRESAAIEAQLRASITMYVRGLAEEGLPAERMLVRIKGAVHDALPALVSPLEARALMENIVRWSIEAYFRDA